MKLVKYYLEILFPLFYFALKYSELYLFLIFILCYSLVYRPLTDGFRLFELGIIPKVNFRIFNPFYMFKMRMLHFRKLYFKQ
jgi:hypothetical protein